ncbi:MAG TPA: hypothetical protein VIM34_02780 [Burkholderiaceae bacterium]
MERGFWLYAWRIRRDSGQFFYIGRTGDSSSRFASSPFARLSQHLDIRANAKANTLLRHVLKEGFDPLACNFELLAFGPLFPEQATMELHRKFRDQIAPLESSLAALFRKRGLEVRGAHGITGIADPDLVAEVERVFEAEFVEGAPWASLSI